MSGSTSRGVERLELDPAEIGRVDVAGQRVDDLRHERAAVDGVIALDVRAQLVRAPSPSPASGTYARRARGMPLTRTTESTSLEKTSAWTATAGTP